MKGGGSIGVFEEVLPSMPKGEIVGNISIDDKGAAPELSLRQRRREEEKISQRRRSRNNEIRKHKREARAERKRPIKQRILGQERQARVERQRGLCRKRRPCKESISQS